MKLAKIVFVAVGALLLVLLFFAFYGVPVRSLISSLAREAVAKSDMDLDIAGPARLTLLPSAALVADDVALRRRNGTQDLFKVDRVRVGVSLASLIRGRIRLTDVDLKRPVMRMEPPASRAGGSAGSRGRSDGADSGGKGAPPFDQFPVETITAEDCTLIATDGRETQETHIASLRVSVVSPSLNERLSLNMEAQIEGRAVRLELGAEAPARLAEGKPVPIDIKLELPGVWQRPSRISAKLVSSGPVLKIDGLNGTLDQGRINGSISVSFAGAKPFIDANIESDLIELAKPSDKPSAPAGATAPAGDRGQSGQAQGWSDQRISFLHLHMFEASMKVSAREVRLNKVSIAPASLEVTLLQDVLSVNLSNSEAYGGQVSGEIVVDSSKDVADVAVRGNLTGLNALPFLTEAFDFKNLEGGARASLNVKGSGASPLQIVSSLEGNTEFVFEDGAVRGLNIPQMARSLVDAIISGWQEKASEQTKFSTFSVSFQIQNGQARTENLRLTGPFVRVTGSGTIDLPGQTLDFRIEPKLVASAEGQSARPGTESWGLGVPVIVQGTWSEPRIHADLPNILSNPEEVLGKFKGAFGGGSPQMGGPPPFGGPPQMGGPPPFGKLMEGLTQGTDRSRTNQRNDQRNNPMPDPLGIADEILRRLQGTTPKDGR